MSVTAKIIKLPPVQAVGHELADALKNSIYVAQSGTVVVGTDTLPAQLFAVPKNILITDVVVQTDSAITGASPDYLVIGDSSDTDLFHSSTDVLNVGWHSAHYGSAKAAGGLLTTDAVNIWALHSPTSSAGQYKVYVHYKPYADENYTEN